MLRFNYKAESMVPQILLGPLQREMEGLKDGDARADWLIARV